MKLTPLKAGDKVVCLKDVSPKRRGSVSDGGIRIGTALTANYPVSGRKYTLRNVNSLPNGKTLLLLEEVRNDHLSEFIVKGLEPGFDAKFFRRLALEGRKQ